jgi:hypothetical protein
MKAKGLDVARPGAAYVTRPFNQIVMSTLAWI